MKIQEKEEANRKFKEPVKKLSVSRIERRKIIMKDNMAAVQETLWKSMRLRVQVKPRLHYRCANSTKRISQCYT